MNNVLINTITSQFITSDPYDLIAYSKPSPFGEITVIFDHKNDLSYFLAKEIAKSLDYQGSEKLTRILDPDEFGCPVQGYLNKIKDLEQIAGPINPRGITLINEPGLYHGTFKSTKIEAIQFRKHVTGTVLPEIRRTGSYLGAQAPATQGYLDAAINQLKIDLMPASTFGRRGVKKFQNSMDMDQITSLLIPEFTGSKVITYKILKESLYEHLRMHGFIAVGKTFPTSQGIDSGVVGIEVIPICYQDNKEVGKSLKTVVYEKFLDNFIESFMEKIRTRENLQKFKELTNNNIIPKEPNVGSDVNISFDNMPTMTKTSHLYENVSNTIN